jgi:hypothetical protein
MGRKEKLNELQKAEARRRLAAGEFPRTWRLSMESVERRSRGCGMARDGDSS